MDKQEAVARAIYYCGNSGHNHSGEYLYLWPPKDNYMYEIHMKAAKAAIEAIDTYPASAEPTMQEVMVNYMA